MPKVVQDFELKVHAGVFDRFLRRMGEGVELANRQNVALRGVGDAAEAADRSVSAATAGLVRQLGPMQDAIRHAFTPEQAQRATDQLIRQMDRVGLSFTNAGHEADRANILARTSLQELAEGGVIAANTIAEARYGERMQAEADKAARAAEQAAARQEAAARRSASSRIREERRATDEIMRLNQVLARSNPLNAVTGRITRTIAMLFSVRRLLRYILNAAKRAPDEVMADFAALKKEGADVFARITVSAMNGMRIGLRSLTKALNSPGGQKFFRVLEKTATMAGRVVGKAMELMGKGIEFIGGHAEQAFTIAAIAAGLFAGQMLVAAAANIAMNWPLYLTIGLLSALVVWLMKAGYTASDIFGTIGEVLAWLYTLAYNRLVDIHNKFAIFAEFLLNVFHDPVNAIGNLFYDLFDWVLSGLETTARAIDAIAAKSGRKWNLGGEIAESRSAVQAEKAGKFAENAIKVDRWEHLDFDEMMGRWGELGERFGAGMTGDALANLLAPEIKAIESDTDAIRKSVQLSEEDLRSLVDTAERQYVNRISLTSQTPIITINGANTGRTAEDRQALADAIAEVLMEQTASGAVIATALP